MHPTKGNSHNSDLYELWNMRVAWCLIYVPLAVSGWDLSWERVGHSIATRNWCAATCCALWPAPFLVADDSQLQKDLGKLCGEWAGEWKSKGNRQKSAWCCHREGADENHTISVSFTISVRGTSNSLICITLRMMSRHFLHLSFQARWAWSCYRRRAKYVDPCRQDYPSGDRHSKLTLEFDC